MNKLYVVFAKSGARYTVRYSFSLMDSGETVAFRDVYALKNEGVSQQPRCPSSYSSGHSFQQPAPHPPTPTVIQPLSQTIYSLSVPTAPKQATSPCLSHNRIRPFNIPTCCVFTIIQILHTHTLINMREQTCHTKLCI